jgi:PhnB protein
MAVRPIPDGFHTITPYLVLDGAGKVIEFLKKAFGAEEIYRHKRPDGGIGHAQVKIRDSMLMLADATKDHPAAPCMIYMYVEDVDAWYERAIKAGGISIMKPMDMYYGDRNAGVKDASGMQWWIGTHKEDIAPEEVERRAAAAAKAAPAGQQKKS